MPEPYLVLSRERADPRDMQHLSGIFQDIVAKNNMSPLTNKIQLTTPVQNSSEESKKPLDYVPVNTKKQKQLRAIAKGNQGAKERLRDAAAQRINRQINQPELY